jgi:hypothetical protein
MPAAFPKGEPLRSLYDAPFVSSETMEMSTTAAQLTLCSQPMLPELCMEHT